MNSQKKFPRAFSFEFFPPKDDDGRAGLRDAITQLAPLKPRFFSVTFGAGGGIRAGTYETVKEIQARGLTAAPHITCRRTEFAPYPEIPPGAPSAAADLENFARKVRAGADSAITQYFYNPDAYRRFVDDCEALGLDI